MPSKKITVLTGTRAEYGLLKPVMQAIAAHADLELQLLVTGMHLAEEFGMSVNDIRADGFHIDAEVPMHPATDTGAAMADAVGLGIQGITEALQKLRPDILLLLGDRTEVLAGAVSALYLNIPIAHIHGGDVTRGGTDESVRHAVTKMAHIHFPATAAAGARIRRMGENPWRIHVTGAPCLDTILSFEALRRDEIAARYGLAADTNYLLLLQHAVSTEPEAARFQINETLSAVLASGMPVLAIYPNSDAGGRTIIAELEKYAEHPHFHLHKSLPHRDFLSLMRHCSCMLGNSSSGIIESSSFQIPVINIGIRQEGRERAENVLDVGHKASDIIAALQKALSPDMQALLKSVRNPYGVGDTGIQIANILATTSTDKRLLQKKLGWEEK